MYLSILFPSILALFAIYKKALTLPGIILAWCFGFIIAYFGNLFAFAALAVTCLLVLLTDKIKKTTKDGTRDIYQINSTILTSVLCIILYYLLENDIFYIMYFAVLGTSLADSMASSIGTLSKKKPFNLFNFEKVEKGASGGVTILGFVASLLGGGIVGVFYLFKILDYKGYLIIVLMSFLGSLIDSVLGIIFQSQYRCIVCKKVVETNVHCKRSAKLIRGYAFVDNNLVNLLSNIVVFIISYLILK